jgi:Domain of unknown function (DUF4349)
MIDEAVLSDLLAEHAGRIPVPASGIDALLTASPRPRSATGAPRIPRPSARVLAAAVVVMVAVGGLWALNDHPVVGGRVTKTAATKAKSTLHGSALLPPAGGAGARKDVANGGIGLRGYTSSGQPAPPRSVATSGGSTPGAAKLPGTVARVVRTGTLDLRIARHSFGTTIGRVTTIAAAAGGFVADAKTFESATTPSGTVTIRVPSGQFSPTVERLRKLGRVLSATTRGEDVTGQYTDLQARLRAATATRAQYLTVLSQATNIGDILAVQDRIQAVQTQIEQLQGQVQQLNDQTTYATVTIAINEPGPKPKAVVVPPHQSGISKAWDNARDGFARRVEGIISHSGSALVILIGLLLLAAGFRMVVPRVRRLLV